MNQPVDEFGRRLREFRKRRGMTGESLSIAVGQRRTYIGRWEREACAVNLAALAKAIRILELSDAESKELFILAAARSTEDAAAMFERPIKVDHVAPLIDDLLPIIGNLIDTLKSAQRVLRSTRAKLAGKNKRHTKRGSRGQ